MTPEQFGADFRQKFPNPALEDMSDDQIAHSLLQMYPQIEQIVNFNYQKPDPQTGFFEWASDAMPGMEKPDTAILANGEEVEVGGYANQAWFNIKSGIARIPAMGYGILAKTSSHKEALAQVMRTVDRDANGDPLIDSNGLMTYRDSNNTPHKASMEDFDERADKIRNGGFFFGLGPNWKEFEADMLDKATDSWLEADKKMERWMEEDQSIAGYQAWTEDSPMAGVSIEGVKQLIHPHGFARAFTDLAPSIISAWAPGKAIQLGGKALQVVGGGAQLYQAGKGAGVISNSLVNTGKAGGLMTKVGESALVPMAMMMGLEGGSTMSESMEYLIKDLGLPPEEAVPIATNTAIIVGVVNGMLEKLQFDRVIGMLKLGPEVKRNLVQRISGDLYKKAMEKGGVTKFLVKTGGWTADNMQEAIVEVMQEVNGMVVQKAIEDGYGMTAEEVLPKVLEIVKDVDQMKEFATSMESQRVFMSTFSAMGGHSAMTGAAGATYRRMMSKQNDETTPTVGVTASGSNVFVKIGEQLTKIPALNNLMAKRMANKLKDAAQQEELMIPGLDNGITGISSMKDLLNALAYQEETTNPIAPEWNKHNKDLRQDNMTDAQKILFRMGKDSNYAANTNAIINEIIESEGAGILDELDSGAAAWVREAIINKVKSQVKSKLQLTKDDGKGGQVVDEENIDNGVMPELFNEDSISDDQIVESLRDQESKNAFDELIKQKVADSEYNVDYMDEAVAQKEGNALSALDQRRQEQADEYMDRKNKDTESAEKAVLTDPNGKHKMPDILRTLVRLGGARGKGGIKTFFIGNKSGFKGMTLPRMRDVARALQIPGYSKLKKQELATLIAEKVMTDYTQSEAVKLNVQQKKAETKGEPTPTDLAPEPVVTDPKKAVIDVKDDIAALERELNKAEMQVDAMVDSGMEAPAGLITKIKALKGKIAALKQVDTRPETPTDRKKKKVKSDAKRKAEAEKKETERQQNLDVTSGVTITPTNDPAGATINPDKAKILSEGDQSDMADTTSALIEGADTEGINDAVEDAASIVDKCGGGL